MLTPKVASALVVGLALVPGLARAQAPQPTVPESTISDRREVSNGQKDWHFVGHVEIERGTDTKIFADDVRFDSPTATAEWGEGILFEQVATLGVPAARAELLVATPFTKDEYLVVDVGPFEHRTLALAQEAFAGGARIGTGLAQDEGMAGQFGQRHMPPSGVTHHVHRCFGNRRRLDIQTRPRRSVPQSPRKVDIRPRSPLPRKQHSKLLKRKGPIFCRGRTPPPASGSSRNGIAQSCAASSTR